MQKLTRCDKCRAELLNLFVAWGLEARVLKKSASRLLDATKLAGQAERDRTIAIMELLNLQKELQGMTEP